MSKTAVATDDEDVHRALLRLIVGRIITLLMKELDE
jgi:hypothetical protein